MFRTFALLFTLLTLLAGCDPLAQVQSAVPPSEDEFVRRCLSRLAVKDFAAVEAMMMPEIVNSDLRRALTEMPPWLPDKTPLEMQIVNYGVVEVDGVRQSDLYYQYRLSDSWGLVNVVLESRGAELQVAGLHFYKSEKTWTEMNGLNFTDKSIVQFAILAAAMFNPLFILFALVQCVRTPVPWRKWLWIIFILVGVTAIQVNWTTGDIDFNPLYVTLLGAGFSKASPISPLFLIVSVPLGAIIFLVKRRKWLLPPPADAPTSG